jgi:PhnB protein
MAARVKPIPDGYLDHFYGGRSGTVADPCGHVWNVSTHEEDLSMGEASRRAAALHEG